MAPSEPAISIIVPTLNEAAGIEAFLRHLQARCPGWEIIVVDGGSEDDTAEIAGSLAQTITAPRGRASQMNAGAAAAAGDVLWFLHADSRLPENVPSALREALRDATLAGGCFRLRIPRPGLAYRISDDLGNLGVDLFRVALGDHGIFARREAFEAVGGFPNVPLMEDAELYRTLRRQGRVRQLRPAIETSPRRWERCGPWRTTGAYFLILCLYLLGVGPQRLWSIYRRLL